MESGKLYYSISLLGGMPRSLKKNMIVKDPITGRIRSAKHVIFVDDIMKTKLTQGLWPTVSKIVAYWKRSNPKQYKSFIVDLQEKKDSRYSRTGASKSKNLRSLVDIPEKIIQMIRAVYPADELPLDKNFFVKFAKEHPDFSVAQKL